MVLGRAARSCLRFHVHVALMNRVLPYPSSRRLRVYSTDLSLLVLGAFAMAGCGPSNDAMNAAPIAVPPQVELMAAFGAAPETVFEAKTAADLIKIQASAQVTIVAVPKGLLVKASGADPQLLLPPFVEGNPCILQVAIDCPTETLIQLFYATRDHPGYSEQQSQRVSLQKGSNIVYFQLNQANLIDPLRLDPGEVPGAYVIERLVARTIPGPAGP